MPKKWGKVGQNGEKVRLKAQKNYPEIKGFTL